MNIIRSHDFHVRNFSICDPEFFDDPDFQSVSELSTEYRCLECREVRNDADILAMETYKLSRACRKYKSKLEIIRENISNIILENENSDDEVERNIVAEIPIFNPALLQEAGDDNEDFADPVEYRNDTDEDFGVMPELNYISNV